MRAPIRLCPTPTQGGAFEINIQCPSLTCYYQFTRGIRLTSFAVATSAVKRANSANKLAVLPIMAATGDDKVRQALLLGG